MKTWLAFLVLNERERAFVGLSPWRDQITRWCRQIVRSHSDNLRDASVVFYSRDDSPTTERRSRGYRPFAWAQPLDESWYEEAVIRHPFEEILRGRSSRPNAADDRQRRLRPSPIAPPVGPGTAFDEVLPGTDQVEPAVAAAHNNLLTWLSAAGAGRWEAFLRACQALELARDARYARRIIRRLVLLGHLTLSDGGDRWTMQPPTVAPLAIEPERLILRGQRTAELLARLPDNRDATPQQGAPDRVRCCELLETGTTELVVTGLRFRCDPSVMDRAQSLPDWRGWLTSPAMRRYDGRDLGKFDRTERWVSGDWTGEPIYFDDVEKRIVGPTGMYRLSRDAQARPPVTAFFDAERQIIVRGDWYGLRFLAGRAGGEQPRAAWDLCHLLVPVEGRWPLLYEQVLVQASGLLPGRSPGWLCYHGIPLELAECLCGKLDVELDIAASPVSPGCERAAV